MGYYMSQGETQFKIKKENKEKALEALKVACISNGGFSWVSDDILINSKTLEAALSECRWNPENDKEDIISIYFTGEKLGSERNIFDAIAPFVEPNSYIYILGESDSLWAWEFKGNICLERDVKLRFNETEEFKILQLCKQLLKEQQNSNETINILSDTTITFEGTTYTGNDILNILETKLNL